MPDLTPDEARPGRPAPARRRRFTLLDIIVLVAATAVGLALGQLGWPRGGGAAVREVTFVSVGVSNGVGTMNFSLAPYSYPSIAWMVPTVARVGWLLPCLAAWTGAYLVARLRGPRPRWRRLRLQPGLVAAAASLAVLLVESALLIGSGWVDGRFRGSGSVSGALFAANATCLLAHHAGWAVIVAWLTLGLTGRWRAEASWVDRWGRALGVAWIIVGPLASLLVDQTTWWGKFIDA